MLTEALIAAAGEGLATIAGAGARALLAARRDSRVPSLPGWAALSSAQGARQKIQRALAASGVSEPDALAVAEFLGTPSGALLARYVAIDVITDRTARIDAALRKHAAALMRLHPATRHVGENVVHEVVASLQYTVQLEFAAIRRTDQREALRIHDMAQAERQARVFSQLEPAAREMWDLGAYSPAQFSQEIDSYCENIAEATSTISMPSLDAERKLPLGAIYVEPPLAGRPGAGRASGGERALMPVLASKARLVVLGDPGGGKSTLVTASVNAYANTWAASRDSVVPFVVQLARYAEFRRQNGTRGGFIDFLAAHLRSSSLADLDETTLRYLLATGQAVVFFDGLDEVLDLAERTEVRDSIEAFARRYCGSAFVVTSREVGYAEAPLDNASFTLITIPAFDTYEVQEFVDLFFDASDVAQADRQSLKTEFLYDSDAIPDLRSNPLMLGLLCLLYETGRSIPKNQAELYRDCATLLFSRWDARRGIKVEVAEVSAAEDAIAQIALQVFRLGVEEFAESWLESALIEFYRRERNNSFAAGARFAAAVLNLWKGRRWLLVSAGSKDGERYYKFAHRTFMEYFAAQQQSYDAPTAQALWEGIGDLVRSRSATVFCRLAAQLHSRHHASAGDDLLVILVESMSSPAPRTRWNVAAFASEALPIIRARPEVKGRACAAVAGVVTAFIGVRDKTPDSSEVYDDVFLDGGLSTVLDDEDDEDSDTRRAMSFSRVTLPFFSLARTAGESWDVLSAGVADAFRQGASLSNSDQVSRARYVKLAAELEALPYSEDWVGLSPRQVEGFVEWSRAIWADESVAEGAPTCLGLDYWLDVYLVRSGRVTLTDFLRVRPSEALLVGGWDLPVIGAPAVGTGLHRGFCDAVAALSSGELPLADMLFCDLSQLGSWFTSGGWVSETLFEALPVDIAHEAAAISAEALSERARVGFVFALAALAFTGEERPTVQLENSHCAVTRAISRVAAVALYPGEIEESRAAIYDVLTDPGLRAQVKAALSLQ